jgi:hypothetical protein
MASSTLELTLAIAAHPNKMPFRGLLVRLDEPSDEPPFGSKGHRILAPVDVARKRLSSIKGMGLNYSKEHQDQGDEEAGGIYE